RSRLAELREPALGEDSTAAAELNGVVEPLGEPRLIEQIDGDGDKTVPRGDAARRRIPIGWHSAR
ncbi:MAG: hypothetical protein JWM05_3277, partial [Acidimicrobiales bacterium]|nr:hypothetical protein [Acidimicrobiales bacterium]